MKATAADDGLTLVAFDTEVGIRYELRGIQVSKAGEAILAVNQLTQILRESQDADVSIEAWHSHAALTEGFHEDEQTHRWTDGLARIPDTLLRPFAGEVTLELRLFPSELRYRVAPAVPRPAGLTAAAPARRAGKPKRQAPARRKWA